jgi:hypothetical protein
MLVKLNNIKRFIIPMSKLVVIILSVYYLYDKLIETEILYNASWRSGNTVFFFSAFFLVVLNWGIEVFKWKLLIKNVQVLSLKYLFFSVMSGVTLGLITPNRIGEFGGRLFYLDKKSRLKGLDATIKGSVSQMLITVLAGVAGLVIVVSKDILSFSSGLKLIFAISILMGLLLILFYFISGNIINKLLFFFKERLSKPISTFSGKEFLKINFLSLLRYLVFFFQFYLLLLFFKIEINLSDAFALIPLVFLTVSFIPSFAFAEMGIRGSASVFFIGMVSSDHIGILVAALLLWLINIAFPAVVGVFGISRLKKL